MMVRIGECPSCQFGNHKGHVRNYAPVPEGVMGGSICPCKGECDQRPNRSIRRQIDLIRRASTLPRRRKESP